MAGDGEGFVTSGPYPWTEYKAGLGMVEKRLWEVRWAGMEDFELKLIDMAQFVGCGELPVLGGVQAEAG